jgi:hypothetical protein
MNFSSANLAVVAYVNVTADGYSPDTNSGVTTTRVNNPGSYEIHLPGDPTQQEPLQQAQVAGRDLLLATVKGSSSGINITADDKPNTNGLIKTVLTATNTPVNAAFSLVILRTLIPPPDGAPA